MTEVLRNVRLCIYNFPSLSWILRGTKTIVYWDVDIVLNDPHSHAAVDNEVLSRDEVIFNQ
jgi:hypothetical protein